MATENEKRRAAAVCDNCGTAHAVRIGPDGEIRPIGTGHGPECTCGDGDLRIMSDDADVLEDANSSDP